MIRRGLVGCAVLWGALVPGVAHAHGKVADGTNYRSEVSDAGAYGLSWEVIGGDSLLSLTNHTGSEVIVVGYDKEPYLRFVPGKGVYENVRSPAVYWNQDRYASVNLPPTADAAADPEWALVSTADHFAWHDHRIHWMSPLLPTSVNADPSVRSKIWDWTIPIRVAGAPLLAQGQLWWEPAPAWWPTMLLWLVPLLLPVAVVAARSRPVGTVWRQLGRTSAVLFWIVLALCAVRLVDDVLASSVTSGRWTPLATGSLVVAVAAALATRTWRGHSGGFVALGVAATLVWWRFWSDAWIQLRSSQLLTDLSPSGRRALVAPSVAVLVPAGVAVAAAAWNYRRFLQANPGHLAAKLQLLRGK